MALLGWEVEIWALQVSVPLGFRSDKLGNPMAASLRCGGSLVHVYAGVTRVGELCATPLSGPVGLELGCAVGFRRVDNATLCVGGVARVGE